MIVSRNVAVAPTSQRARCARFPRLSFLAARRGIRNAGAPWYGTGAQDRLADILIMGVAGLDLLRDGVHIAKPPLELVGAEDGGGAGHVEAGGNTDAGGLMAQG